VFGYPLESFTSEYLCQWFSTDVTYDFALVKLRCLTKMFGEILYFAGLINCNVKLPAEAPSRARVRGQGIHLRLV